MKDACAHQNATDFMSSIYVAVISKNEYELLIIHNIHAVHVKNAHWLRTVAIVLSFECVVPFMLNL